MEDAKWNWFRKFIPYFAIKLRKHPIVFSMKSLSGFWQIYSSIVSRVLAYAEFYFFNPSTICLSIGNIPFTIKIKYKLYYCFMFFCLNNNKFKILKPSSVNFYSLSVKIEIKISCILESSSKINKGAWIICLIAPRHALLAIWKLFWIPYLF